MRIAATWQGLPYDAGSLAGLENPEWKGSKYNWKRDCDEFNSMIVDECRWILLRFKNDLLPLGPLVESSASIHQLFLCFAMWLAL